MRWRGVNHVELSVLEYEASVAFYDQMFGWLGYRSFSTLDIGYRSTYYMARFPWPHSYIGIQPAHSGVKHDHAARPVGLHHLALWGKNRREIDAFYEEFLLPQGVTVTETPAEYPIYAPGYYGVFFDDPLNGFHWELAYLPRLPSWGQIRRFRQAWQDKGPKDEAGEQVSQFRTLPSRQVLGQRFRNR